jgi:hypothetical protein
MSFLFINVQAAKVLFSKKIGGSTGANFTLPITRADILSTDRITRIAIRHGRRIERIVIEYANVRDETKLESVGNEAGKWSYIRLDPDEFITYITGRSGTLIDQITFHTSKRRSFGPFGGNGGNPFEINIPSNGMVIGFTGKYGPSINQIGLIYKIPDESFNKGTIMTAPIPEESSSDIDQISITNFLQFSTKNEISSVVEMNGRGNQEPLATDKMMSDGSVRDHRTKNQYNSFDTNNKDRKSSTIIIMNGRGNQEPLVKEKTK